MGDTSAIRSLIINQARAEVLAGSHYLTGSDGGYPVTGGEAPDGLDGREVKLLNINETHQVAVETAKYSNRLCHGRADRVGGYTMHIKDKKYLQDYLGQFCPPSTWCYGLTPRSLDWTTVLVAESCQGKRHFDCIFFVNWVLTKALQKKKLAYEFHQWINPNVAPVTVLKLHDVTADTVQDADIFVNMNTSPKHIGFFLNGGLTIHASGSDKGVIQGDWEKARYTHVVRLKESYLKIG